MNFKIQIITIVMYKIICCFIKINIIKILIKYNILLIKLYAIIIDTILNLSKILFIRKKK